MRTRPGAGGDEKKGRDAAALPHSDVGAGNGTRTRDIHLGKVALYQLSYSRL